MFAVEPSEYIPEAINCWVRPAAKFAGEAGIIAMDDNVGDMTVKVTGMLATPDRVAVILIVPVATAVAKPAGETVAPPVLELAQVT
jgi:hypothetical protein